MQIFFQLTGAIKARVIVGVSQWSSLAREPRRHICQSCSSERKCVNPAVTSFHLSAPWYNCTLAFGLTILCMSKFIGKAHTLYLLLFLFRALSLSLVPFTLSVLRRDCCALPVFKKVTKVEKWGSVLFRLWAGSVTVLTQCLWVSRRGGIMEQGCNLLSTYYVCDPQLADLKAASSN